MSKIAILDDFVEYAQMAAAPLKQAGHETLIALAPIDFERVLDFGPDVVVLGLYRKAHAFDRPIESLESDVLGFAPLVEMERYPAINVLPIVLLGHGVSEQDLETTVKYDAFLTFPRDVARYPATIEEVAGKNKSRRKISGYVCPTCGGRLTFSREPARDLFCPRDGTVVAVIDQRDALVTTRDGNSRQVLLASLLAPGSER